MLLIDPTLCRTIDRLLSLQDVSAKIQSVNCRVFSLKDNLRTYELSDICRYS